MIKALVQAHTTLRASVQPELTITELWAQYCDAVPCPVDDEGRRVAPSALEQPSAPAQSSGHGEKIGFTGGLPWSAVHGK